MKALLIAALTLSTSLAFAEAVTIDSVSFAYDIGTENSFDFAGGSTLNKCDSYYYRTIASTPDSINRKFSMILMAIAADKKIMVNTEGCSEDRMLVGWVRVYK